MEGLGDIGRTLAFMRVMRRGGLRPGRSALGVVPELAEFLRAAAAFGDLRGPLDGGFARREFQDTEAAVELLGDLAPLSLTLLVYGELCSKARGER